MGRVLLESGTPLTVVSLFRYLVRTFLSSDDNWTLVERNLQRAQGKWGRLAKILGREGADRITSERFSVVVVQEVILFGIKACFMTSQLEKSLEGFYQRAERQMAGMGPKRQRYGALVYPPIAEALTMVVLEYIGVYIAHS